MSTIVVAADTDSEARLLAHALPDLGEVTHHGTALCGIPAEYLTIVPGMAWEQVAPASRCQHCQQEWLAAGA